jgi:hypothetical protein
MLLLLLLALVFLLLVLVLLLLLLVVVLRVLVLLLLHDVGSHTVRARAGVTSADVGSPILLPCFDRWALPLLLINPHLLLQLLISLMLYMPSHSQSPNTNG